MAPGGRTIAAQREMDRDYLGITEIEDTVKKLENIILNLKSRIEAIEKDTSMIKRQQNFKWI